MGFMQIGMLQAKTPTKEVSAYCKENYEDFEREACEEDCSETDNNKEIKGNGNNINICYKDHKTSKQMKSEVNVILFQLPEE